MHRRDYLVSVSAVATIGIAGCTSGGDGTGQEDDTTEENDTTTEESGGNVDTEILIYANRSTSTAHSAVQALANVVNQNNDTWSVEARPTQGTRDNFGRLDEGVGEMALLPYFGTAKMSEGVGAFSELSFTPNGVMNMWSTPIFFVTARDDIETLDDISSSHSVSPAPAGHDHREVMSTILEYAGVEYQETSIGWSEQGSAMNEGRLDVGVAALVNGVTEPSWLQEMKSVVDVNVVTIPDDVLAQMQDAPLMVTEEVDMTQFEGINSPDTITGAPLVNWIQARSDVPNEVVNGFLDVLWNHKDELAEAHPFFELHREEPQHWVKNQFEVYPMHPAAVDFYEEQDIDL